MEEKESETKNDKIWIEKWMFVYTGPPACRSKHNKYRKENRLIHNEQ